MLISKKGLHWKICLFLIIAIPLSDISAQDSNKYFGMTAGYLNSTLKLNFDLPEGVTKSRYSGYSMGVMALYRVSDLFDLCGELVLSKKGIKFEDSRDLFYKQVKVYTGSHARTDTDLSLMGHFTPYEKNAFEFFVYPGLNIGFNAGDQYTDLSLDGLIGAGIYINHDIMKIKILDLRYIHGLTNILSNPNTMESGEKYSEHNRGFLISAGILYGI